MKPIFYSNTNQQQQHHNQQQPNVAQSQTAQPQVIAPNHAHLHFLSHTSNTSSRINAASLLGVQVPTLINTNTKASADSKSLERSIISMTVQEKLVVVVEFLKECLKTKTNFLTCNTIFARTGVDLLRSGDTSLLEALKTNQSV